MKLKIISLGLLSILTLGACIGCSDASDIKQADEKGNDLEIEKQVNNKSNTDFNKEPSSPRKNLIGKSDKPFKDFYNEIGVEPKPLGDEKANIYLSQVVGSGDMIFHLLDYYNQYMNVGGHNFIINNADDTLTSISDMGEILVIEVKRYVIGEENDLDMFNKGETLHNYFIYKENGDIDDVTGLSQHEESSNAESVETETPKEYETALKKAENYNNVMPMSKIGLYNQLTSDFEKFSSEAAQYAVDNINADWSLNALKKAQQYQNEMAMSPGAIYDQLTSEIEGYTAEEAQYAIDNLN